MRKRREGGREGAEMQGGREREADGQRVHFVGMSLLTPLRRSITLPVPTLPQDI